MPGAPPTSHHAAYSSYAAMLYGAAICLLSASARLRLNASPAAKTLLSPRCAAGLVRRTGVAASAACAAFQRKASLLWSPFFFINDKRWHIAVRRALPKFSQMPRWYMARDTETPICRHYYAAPPRHAPLFSLIAITRLIGLRSSSTAFRRRYFTYAVYATC